MIAEAWWFVKLRLKRTFYFAGENPGKNTVVRWTDLQKPFFISFLGTKQKSPVLKADGLYQCQFT
jgi:hypothetical protein